MYRVEFMKFNILLFLNVIEIPFNVPQPNRKNKIKNKRQNKVASFLVAEKTDVLSQQGSGCLKLSSF